MAITKKNRREFIEDMFFKLENVPIEQIVGSRVPLKQQGAHLYGSCPSGFSRPNRIRSRVVFPTPDGPHRAVTPTPAVKDTFSSTGRSP